MEAKCCGNCLFWKRDCRERHDDIGICRRNPPVFIPHLLNCSLREKGEQIDAPSDSAVFNSLACGEGWHQPGVYAEDWCGEWKAINGTHPTT